jgi:hypothetical protein
MSRTELTSGIFGNPNPTPIVPVGIVSNGNTSSIIPASGFYGNSWPSQSGSVIPQGISAGGWTIDPLSPLNSYDRGYAQQTFLGASIRNFNMNGGFGDTSSTLSVDLVVDEFNKSDSTAIGLGDDVYHNGVNDNFTPPMAGSPVYFKFGPNLATVEQAYRKTFDTIYRTSTIGTIPRLQNAGTYDKDNFTSIGANQFVNLSDNVIYDFNSLLNSPLSKGKDHIVFGGILQSYVQNRGFGGNPLYSVQVTDPREILSNVVVILNDYAGTTFNTKNIFNVYGFLEHNMTAALSGSLQSSYPSQNILIKRVDSAGNISYGGSLNDTSPMDSWIGQGGFPAFGATVPSFPITGTGFSRRGPQGIPYYRVRQALSALMSVDYTLPQEYERLGFGNIINFRGYNYVVDFSGLPQLPDMYFVDFDQINLLDLALEICDITSRELFVSLLPVINHPACKFLYDNQNANPNRLIAGIIRLDSIDKSVTPNYGSIKTYIDNLSSEGILVDNQDVGYELSNVTTDKFVVGAQEVDMYCFSTNADRDFINIRNRRSGGTSDDGDWQQWLLEKQLLQQVIPYYGLLGNKAVTIPKGWGSYQQILLDTTGLNANGVGAYYVATEMELRCASVSYECWKNFLQQYNNVYLESIEDNDSYEGTALNGTPAEGEAPHAPNISENYAVTVPRSVFDTYAITKFGPDGLPSSPCNPPYGYPLYYKRMTKLGIPEGGLTNLQGRLTSIITGIGNVRSVDASNFQDVKNSFFQELESVDYGSLSSIERDYYNRVKTALSSTPPNAALLNDLEESVHSILGSLPRLAKKGTDNALKVYNFLKKIADENLGKKFLVKIPNKVNLGYRNLISWKGSPNGGEYGSGPFGFMPRPATSGIGDLFSDSFWDGVARSRDNNVNMIKSFLIPTPDSSQANYVGSLRVNYNPISEKHEFNYTPTNLGGYFPFDLYSNTLSSSQINSMGANTPTGVRQLLIPQDATNFLNDNGRLSAYVRFDDSQDLSFANIGAEEFTQQLLTSNGMVPDLCEFLENVGEDKFESFRDADADRPDLANNPPRQCAFVKCTVDENFYMPPKTALRSIPVYGAASSRPKLSPPRKVFVPCSGWEGGVYGSRMVPGSGIYVSALRYTEYDFYPTPTGIGNSPSRLDFISYANPVLNSNIIGTEIYDLDTSNVYVLITLPNKLVPTKDSRFRDGANQKDNPYKIKHYLTMDVVKGLPEFENPAYSSSVSATNIGEVNAAPAAVRSAAWLASKKSKEALQFGFPYAVQQSAPSPVYPDLVVLPLISKERCYGPWVSSQIDPQGSSYANIGGRVEFIKDENLSPWNYAGYELMNQAGILQAQFANGLLLFSERGGFSYPGMPRASLCQALLSGGPLVTNITVDVSEAGIKTTVKMDLYTASFGKLQKQKQDLISKISRERQKLREERNALIRKGLGKAQTSTNNLGNINLRANLNLDIPKSAFPNNIVASVASSNSLLYSPDIGGGLSSSFGTDSDPSQVKTKDYVWATTFQTDKDIADTLNIFDDTIQSSIAEYNAGSSKLEDKYTPFSYEPYHGNMPNIQYVDFAATNRIYEDFADDGFKINDDDVTAPA